MIAVSGRPDLTHACIWVGKYSDSYMILRVGCRLKIGAVSGCYPIRKGVVPRGL